MYISLKSEKRGDGVESVFKEMMTENSNLRERWTLKFMKTKGTPKFQSHAFL